MFFKCSNYFEKQNLAVTRIYLLSYGIFSLKKLMLWALRKMNTTGLTAKIFNVPTLDLTSTHPVNFQKWLIERIFIVPKGIIAF